MIATLLISFTLATVVLWLNPRNSPMRWFSASLYAASSSVAVYFLDIHLPDASHVLINTLVFLSDMSIGFFFGMFGVVYSESFNRRQQRQWMIVALMIAVFVGVWTPLAPDRMINYEQLNELPMVLYVSLCLTLSAVLLIMAHIREPHPYKKLERWLTNLFVIPIMGYIVSSYILYLFDINLFQLNYVPAILMLATFLWLGIRKDALGVKIKIEMLKADASLHVLKGGTSLLNHTIKSEMGKIDLLLHQIKQTCEQHQSPDLAGNRELLEMLDMAEDSVHHVQTMMTRINERMQAIVVNLKKGSIVQVLEQCLETLKQTIGDQISIHCHLEQVPEVYHDPVHLKETVMNVLNNAVESIQDQGEITVNLTERDKTVVLEIKDTGHGISADALHTVFKPFFSTKGMKHHYGLGLFYCQNVIAKHQGSIQVESTPGKGSCFSIHLRK